MANAIATIRIMPETVEVDLHKIEKQAMVMVKEFAGEGDTRVNIVPIAFGLKALDITFIMDESLGSPEPLELKIATIEGVNSVETTDVRRAVG